MIKTWSKNQSLVALSSAEAEMYGLVKATSETLGIMTLLKEWDLEFGAKMYSDASAALGIIERRGLGKLRHIDTAFLWLQEANAKRSVSFNKVPGAENPADLCTKNVGQDLICKHTARMGFTFMDGRPQNAPELNFINDTVYNARCDRHATNRCKNRSKYRKEIKG